MRHLLLITIAAALASAAGFALAQTTSRPGPGFHAVALPAPSSGATKVQPRVLLETPTLKLVTIVIPKGTVLPKHTAPNHVSIQALSGTGEIRMAGKSEALDGSHMVVLPPNLEHEVQASSSSDLVLLVHHLRGGVPRGPEGDIGLGRRSAPGEGGPTAVPRQPGSRPAAAQSGRPKTP